MSLRVEAVTVPGKGAAAVRLCYADWRAGGNRAGKRASDWEMTPREAHRIGHRLLETAEHARQRGKTTCALPLHNYLRYSPEEMQAAGRTLLALARVMGQTCEACRTAEARHEL